MNLQFEQAQHHGFHSVFCQLSLPIFRKEYTQVQHGLHKLRLMTELVCPLPKRLRPILFIFLSVFFSIPQKAQLVLSKFVAVDSRQILIERIQGYQIPGFEANYFLLFFFL